MKPFTHRHRTLCAIFALCFSVIRLSAQPSLTVASPRWNAAIPAAACGLDSAFLASLIDSSGYHLRGAPISVVTGFAANAIDTCGKFALYFEDINSNTYIGFDDTTMVGGITLGQIRRNTYCEVLGYIQSIFDFSLVSSSDLIKIYINISYANAAGYHAPIGTSFFAKCGPYFAYTPNRYDGGYLNDYVTTGIDPATSYHATLIVNFDATSPVDSTYPIDYQQDTAGPYIGCDVDLYSILLHETTHGLGWVSLITFPHMADSLNNLAPQCIVANAFSKLDSTIFVGTVFPDTVLQKLVLGVSGDSLYLNPGSALADNNYWINNLPAPQNHPVLSGDYVPGSGSDTFLIKSYISHLDDNQADYSYREHISPGDRPEYVMGPYTFEGVKHRQYTKAELQVLCGTLGYKYTGPDSAVIFGNHTPFSRKMAALDIWHGFNVIADTMQADFTMTNNGTPITINLASLVATGNLSDADGDTIRIDTATVSNIRGFGSYHGNDHSLAAFSAGNTVITYTPRPDFYGRAQLGFSLFDGKEDGAYYVLTIDVRQGIYPAYTVGTNMVENPGFENGTEMKVTTQQNKAYTVVNEDGFHEGRAEGGSYSDGHIFNEEANQVAPFGAGIAVKNSFLSCYHSLSNENEGASGTSFVSPLLSLPSVDSSLRYQSFTGANTFCYYYLLASARHCHQYTLSFDAYIMSGGSTFPIAVGFKDDTSAFVRPNLTYYFFDTLRSLSGTSWTHVTIPFWYCGDDSSHIMFLQNLGANFSLDNLSLVEDTAAPPLLVVSIAATPLPGCLTQLAATVANAACDTAYLWSATGLTSLTSALDTVISNDSATYYLTVNDGCRSAIDSVYIGEIIPGPISGPVNVCAGTAITLADSVSGGGWTTSDSSIAAVDSNLGIVTGISAGTAIITYGFCRDFVTYAVTVSPVPSAITGDLHICLGSSDTLHDSVSGGVWTSSYAAVATIGSLSGVVTAAGTGGAIITYATGPSCYSIAYLIVNRLPAAISGAALVCTGSTATLTDPGGGTWSSGDLGVALVGSGTGIVTGVTAGTAAITYTLSTGCSTTTTVTVVPAPGAISGVSSICPGSTTTYADDVSGGTWTSSNASVATVGSSTGIVHGVAPGTAIITYKVPCGDVVTETITIEPLPAPIIGPSFLCVAAAASFTDSVGGGTWSVSDTGFATIDSVYGRAVGIRTGTVTITYTSCGNSVTKTVTVNPEVGGPWGATFNPCIGDTVTYTDATTGGTWVSSNTAPGTINAETGVYLALAAGETNIRYVMPDGCVSSSITVEVFPYPKPITGSLGLCMGSTGALTDSSYGGTWYSGDPSVASIDSFTGAVTGVTAGTALISYAINYFCFATTTETVYPLPGAINGALSFCASSSATLADTPASGLWTSGDDLVAVIGSATGIVSGIGPGTVIITYTIGICTAEATLTVAPAPAPLSGSFYFCAGSSVTLIDGASGGTWSSGNSSVASVGSSTGVVTGVAAGTVTISYTLADGCTATETGTIATTPAMISGAASICMGSHTTLSDAVTGGIWTSANTAIATVGSLTGVVTGAHTGTVIITYAIGSCYVTIVETVNPVPLAITGTTTLCDRTATTLSDATAGGTWASGNSSVAAVDSGIVTGVGAGTALISYILPDGCFAVTTVTVNYTASLTGSDAVCEGLTTSLSDSSSGGVWSSSDTDIATVGSGSGIVTGLTAGTAVISYTYHSCTSVMTVTVNNLPGAITGTASLCAGGSTRLADTSTGGTWSSSNTLVAAVTLGTGIVTGVSAGSAVISYTLGDGCFAVLTVTVNPLSAITGPSALCAGSGITLSDATGGGTWTSGSTSVATINSTTGAVTGVAAGTSVISYIIYGGCYVTRVITVDPLPTLYTITGGGAYCVGGSGVDISLTGSATGITYKLYDGLTFVSSLSGTGSALDFGPETLSGTYFVVAVNASTGCTDTMSGTATVTIDPVPGPITGLTSLCAGNTTSLSDASIGGTWSSGNTSVTTVSGGTVTGVAAGTALISYTLDGLCSATNVIIVYPGSGSGACTPCSYFTASFSTIGTSGSITSSITPGSYYVPNSVTVYGVDTLRDAVIVMASGALMTIDTGAVLTIDSSHILSCAMWDGMTLRSGPGSSARLSVIGGSLIEDATTAVYIANPVNSLHGLVLDCDNAVFNRNMTAINVNYYNSLNAAYPFLIRNTVISGRDYSSYAGYPYSWPPTLGTNGLKTPYSSGNIFDPPFNIQNYTGTNCKNGQPPYAGVVLDSVGADTPNTQVYPGVSLPTYYTSFTLGDTTEATGNLYQNLIDNVEFGVYATNSNVDVVNSAFINIDSREPLYTGVAGATTISGDAIYAIATPDLYNHDRLRVWTPGGNPYHNLFYGFLNAVACYDYFHVIGQYNYIINKNTGATFIARPGGPGPTGNCGFWLQSAKYDTIDISYDTITNVSYGVTFWAMQDPVRVGVCCVTPPWQYTGQINVNGNLIQVNPGGITAISGTQRVQVGISLQNALNQVAAVPNPSIYGGSVMVADNQINDAYDGIYVNNFWRQPATAYNNTIYVRSYMSNALQYGINNTHCSNSTISYNTIQGADVSDMQRDSMRAVYASSNNKLNVGCNTESNTGRGFEFFIQNPITKWYQNNMSANGKGFVLNGGVIGPQGNPLGLTPQNVWTGGLWSSSSPETYVINAVPTSSPMYVSGTYGSLGYPDFNSVGTLRYLPYLPGRGLDPETSTSTYFCYPVTPGTEYSLYEYMAQQEVPYGYSLIPANWMGQFRLWESILIDSTMADSSRVLAVFDSMAQNSRYAYLTALEIQIASGNFDSAWAMLGYNIDSMANTSVDSTTQVKMADGISSDYIVQNYQQFYSLYMTYVSDTLSGSDSLAILALAQLCPEENGTVVYQARALYSLIYNDLSMFNDDSCMNIDSTYIGERHSNPNSGLAQTNAGQVYKIYPNPNNGNFTIAQLMPDMQPVSAEIFDVVGQCIFRNDLQFAGGTYDVQLNGYAAGVYIVRLKDARGREFNLKFVKE